MLRFFFLDLDCSILEAAERKTAMRFHESEVSSMEGTAAKIIFVLISFLATLPLSVTAQQKPSGFVESWLKRIAFYFYVRHVFVIRNPLFNIDAEEGGLLPKKRPKDASLKQQSRTRFSRVVALVLHQGTWLTW